MLTLVLDNQSICKYEKCMNEYKMKNWFPNLIRHFKNSAQRLINKTQFGNQRYDNERLGDFFVDKIFRERDKKF